VSLFQSAGGFKRQKKVKDTFITRVKDFFKAYILQEEPTDPDAFGEAGTTASQSSSRLLQRLLMYCLTPADIAESSRGSVWGGRSSIFQRFSRFSVGRPSNGRPSAAEE
jgi:hypothetical protein